MEFVPASWKMSKCRTGTGKAEQRRAESKLAAPWFWPELVAWSIGTWRFGDPRGSVQNLTVTQY